MTITCQSMILSRRSTAAICGACFVLLGGMKAISTRRAQNERGFLRYLRTRRERSELKEVLLMSFRVIFRPLCMRGFARFSLRRLVLTFCRSTLGLFLKLLRRFGPLRDLINDLRGISMKSKFRRMIRHVSFMTICNVLIRNNNGSGTNTKVSRLQGFRSIRFKRLSIRRGRISILLKRLLSNLCNAKMFASRL